MHFEKTDSNEILPVTVLFKEDGEFILKCPHCGVNRTVQSESGSFSDIKGEIYEDNLCTGSFEISYDAKLVNDISIVEDQPFDLDPFKDEEEEEE
ncbi:hypothetical protein VB319_25765 [Vibrio parahaemolyticus]|uniref:hypothetical protein n=1 Tax=Vibrio parahaemolyticus TaxID=670 RepID=UPI002B1FDAC9|nr:hypothetical protein [Vibrio parahaemolyticus]MEA5357340.1 hypothetical protein [Vibrio parahaemolyticus]